MTASIEPDERPVVCPEHSADRNTAERLRRRDEVIQAIAAARRARRRLAHRR